MTSRIVVDIGKDEENGQSLQQILKRAHIPFSGCLCFLSRHTNYIHHSRCYKRVQVIDLPTYGVIYFRHITLQLDFALPHLAHCNRSPKTVR